MRIASLALISSMILLSACTWWGSRPIATSQYPSTPINASTGIKTPVQAPVGGSYTAKGTEPFWAVDIIPGKATLSRPTGSGTTSTSFEVTEDDKWALVVVKWVKGEIFVNMTKWSCSDGMSDTRYAYNTTVLIGAESLTGCALKQK